MILESSLILQIIPPKNPGVSFNQGRITRSNPMGADLPTARLQDLATCDDRRSHAGMVQQTLRFKPSGKNDCKMGPQKLFRKYGVFFLGIQTFLFSGCERWKKYFCQVDFCSGSLEWALQGGTLSWLLRWHGAPINGRNINGLGDRCYNPTVIGVKFHPTKIWVSPWRVRSNFF